MKKILIALMRMLPLRRFIIFESHPDFSDNSYALYQEFLRRGLQKRYRIYWMKTFRDSQVPHLPQGTDVFEREPSNFREMIKRAYILNCSQFIIDCNSFVHKRRKKQVRIHLGHGMPIKMDLQYSRKFGDCDKYLIQSEFWREIYENQIQVPREVLCPLGYPRNDVLVNPVEITNWRKSVREFKRVIIWMPTYRQHRLHRERDIKNAYPYGLPCIQSEAVLDELEQCLSQKQILVLFRPHPVQELSLFNRKRLKHIQIADDAYLATYGVSLYELLAHTDALITDYSSVYFDYLLTDKPIALTIEDKKEYFQHFVLAFSDYKQYIKGFYVESHTDLFQFVSEIADGVDSAKKEREQAREMFHASVQSGVSAQRITDMLIAEYGMEA